MADATDAPENNDAIQPKVDTRELSFGEKLVGIGFNPADDKVAKAKKLFADAADLLNDENEAAKLAGKSTQDSQRLFSHAVCSILDAQMNVVKVITLKY